MERFERMTDRVWAESAAVYGDLALERVAEISASPNDTEALEQKEVALLGAVRMAVRAARHALDQDKAVAVGDERKEV